MICCNDNVYIFSKNVDLLSLPIFEDVNSLHHNLLLLYKNKSKCTFKMNISNQLKAN
jgi:hypothetical protein